MKKIFTLFAVALVSLCAYAQDAPEHCPSQAQLVAAESEQDANKVMVYIQLKNASQNLNGFNSEFEKCLNDVTIADDEPGSHVGTYCPEIQWVADEEDGEAAGFSGYGDVILAMWDVSNPTWRETKLFQKADLKSSFKHYDETDQTNLVVIEILSTNDCRFFPVLEEFTTIARFTVDMSACADGDYRIIADNIASRWSFAYTGGVEGTRAWTSEMPVKIILNKVGDKVTQVVDAISTINTDKAVDNRIFDIQGRELQSVPEHGIYIQNGKKYVK